MGFKGMDYIRVKIIIDDKIIEQVSIGKLQQNQWPYKKTLPTQDHRNKNVSIIAL